MDQINFVFKHIQGDIKKCFSFRRGGRGFTHGCAMQRQTSNPVQVRRDLVPVIGGVLLVIVVTAGGDGRKLGVSFRRASGDHLTAWRSEGCGPNISNLQGQL